MNSASESNVKNIAVIAFVSVLLFGIFYYLITDVSNSAPLTADTTVDSSVVTEAQAQNFLADTEKPTQQEVKGDTVQKSVFKDLAAQQVPSQPTMVLAGSDTTVPESTVPATGSDTIFAAFTVSSLIMFTGIYLLLTQPKNTALAKFEKRIIRELD
jgi:hypothetical protein